MPRPMIILSLLALVAKLEACKSSSSEPAATFTAPYIPEKAYLMLLGGQPDLNVLSHGSDTVEVAALFPDAKPLPDCMKEVERLPSDNLLYPLGMTLGSVPILCGGDDKAVTDNDGTHLTQCRSYVKSTNSWARSGSLPQARSSAGHTYDSAWGMVITGGFNEGGTIQDNGVTTADGSSFDNRAIPSYSRALRYTCPVVIDENNLFMTGIDFARQQNELLAFQMTKGGSWRTMPSTGKRFGYACGLVTRGNGDKEIVIAGGVDKTREVVPVQIFSLKTNTWRAGKGAAFDLKFMSRSLPYGTSFIVAGGQKFDKSNPTEPSKSVFWYDPEAEQMVEMEGTFKQGKKNALALYVTRETFHNCN